MILRSREVINEMMMTMMSWLTFWWLLFPWLTAGIIGLCEYNEEVPACEPCIKSCRDKRYRRWCPETCSPNQKCFCKYGYLEDDLGRCVPESMCFVSEYSRTSRLSPSPQVPSPGIMPSSASPPARDTRERDMSNIPARDIRERDMSNIIPPPHLIRLLMIEDGHPYHVMHGDHVHPDVHYFADIHHDVLHVWNRKRIFS